MTLFSEPPERYPHLELRRTEAYNPRWKQTAPSKTPPRTREEQGLSLQVAAQRVVDETRRQPRPQGIDPALVLRVRTVGSVSEEDWRRAGFTVVGIDSERTLLLFSTDEELTTFRDRVEKFRTGEIAKKNPPYNWLAFVDPDSLAPLGPEDRIGPYLRELIDAGGPDPDVEYRLDVELWYLGTNDATQQKVEEVERFVSARGGRITDRLMSGGTCLLRARIAGRHIREMLEIRSVAQLDQPPRLAYSVLEVAATRVDHLLPISSPPSIAPRVCIIDGGVDRGHPLLMNAIGETTGIPASVGDGLDVNGHGTEVAGVALYFDVEECRRTGRFEPQFWIDAAAVTNAQNEFDDDRLVPNQMREAITYFHERGCRIFNVSLGAKYPPYDGGKPTVWAATLDNLASELDVLIIVSSGNYDYVPGDEDPPDSPLRDYPGYLLQPPARITEPAMAANVLTVGAIAPLGLPYYSQRNEDDIAPDPIALPGQPSPFTRSGLGVRGAIKPDLVEEGGNYSFDRRLNRVIADRGLSVVTLNWQHNQGLFALDRGTSFAAPRVSHVAARVLSEFPDASANLLRALLVQSAEMPANVSRLAISAEDKFRLCGYGRPDADRALSSTHNRVVLVAEGELRLDWFHVYEVPIPEAFRDTKGDRRITVTLAFDPPVRHRRAEYLGNAMNFKLIRGQDLDEVVRVHQARQKGQKKKGIFEGPSPYCDFDPGASRRNLGTVQRGVWCIRQARSLRYDEPFYLVVTNESQWQDPTDAVQRYAVVVCLEHTANWIRLYDVLRQRHQVSRRVRVRA